MFPADMYLWGDQKRMEAMEYEEFHAYCRELVLNKGVPCIGVIGGLNGKDIVRVTVQIMFGKEMFALSAGYPAIGNVVGGTEGKNIRSKEEFLAKLDQAYKNLS